MLDKLTLQILNNIINAVTFAELRTYYNGILKTDEFQTILESIPKLYGTINLIFPSLQKNPYTYYDLVEIASY